MYYIVGKKINEGIIGDDGWGDLSRYFELGWEYAVTHLHIKHMYNEGKLKPEDIIVTIKDRMFLYTGFWKNVISIDDFIKIPNKTNDVIDLCENAGNLLPRTKDGKYEYFYSDLDIIKNIDYKNIDHLPTKEKFCCLHLRYRDWANFRNLDISIWLRIIEKLKQKNKKIFIFGKTTNHLCDNDTIFYVDLDEYASLLHHNNCDFLIGTVSGGSLVGQIFSNKNCTNNIIITDNQTQIELNETNDNYKVFYHSQEFNFSDVNINFIKLNEINEFIEIL